jgi:ribosomal protein L11 methyltransferase
VELRVVRVAVTDNDVDIVVDTLWRFGPEAVSEHVDAAGQTTLVAGYPSQTSAERVWHELRAGHAATLHPVPDDEWVSTWRAHEPHHVVGPLTLRLPEHPIGDGLDVVIEPGATFGFSHESTLLALELLTSDAIDPRDQLVADIGCGSGILSVASCRLGASRVDAVDIDKAAIAHTLSNASRNDVVECVHATLGSVSALPASNYGLVVANVLVHVHIELADVVIERLAPGATLIVSGFLTDDIPRLLDAFGALTVLERRDRNQWAALALR